MSARIWNHSLLITASAVAIVLAISVGTAWHATDGIIVRFSPFALLPILAAAFISGSFRVLRFYFFLRQSGVAISFANTFVAQMVGMALGVTPGRVGEIFKLHLIRERTGAPVAQTAPLLLLDRLTEGGGFMVLAFASAPLLPALRARVPTPALTIIGLIILLAFALTRRWWSSRLTAPNFRWIDSRLWQLGAPHLKNLWRGMETSFTLPQALGGLILSVTARLADSLIVLLIAQMLGVELELPEAVFILAMSGLAGGISFLPAGLGAVETTMVGLFVLIGAALANAMAIALVTRLFTLWIWVALGLAFAFALRLPTWKTNPNINEDE